MKHACLMLVLWHIDICGAEKGELSKEFEKKTPILVVHIC